MISDFVSRIKSKRPTPATEESQTLANIHEEYSRGECNTKSNMLCTLL